MRFHVCYIEQMQFFVGFSLFMGFIDTNENIEESQVIILYRDFNC